MSKKDLAQLDVCGVAGCGKERREHTVAEEEGRLNHEFSKDGRLVVLSRDKPARPPRGNSQRSSGRVVTGAVGDPILRFVLINKGLITVEELDEAERLLRATGALGPTPGLGRVSDAAPNA